MIVLKAAQEKILGALQAVSGIVERRHTLPILANVLLRKTGAQIELTTSDLEIQVRTTQELGGDDANFSTTVGARTVPVGNTDPALRDNPPAIANDMFMGYEQPNFISRVHPELFAAQDTARNATGSAGAETFTSTTVTNGSAPKFIDGNTAAFLYHDPAAPVGNITPARTQYDASRNEMWVKANSVGGGYHAFLYYTTDGSNPEGAAGRGNGTTKVVEMAYRHNDDAGASDWWSATPLPGDFTATSKYKIGIYKDANDPWWPGNADAVTRKQKMMTTFETNALDLAALSIRPHNDYGVTQTGLSEGMHVIRARAFLQRGGQASIYNTFTQSFYYDAQRPLGEVRFPAADNDTVGGSEYGVVVRTDPSVTEVWYHIDDNSASNDDSSAATEPGAESADDDMGAETEKLYTRQDPVIPPDMPILVLVNRFTASAAEIVSGALQDYRRAVVIGERSYGKGSVQAPFELGDGSVLKLTISLYYTPADRLIQASGILPDVLVGTELTPYKDSIPELEPERAQPRHLRPEAFGYPPSTQNAEGEALRAAGSDAQLRAAVQHLRSHIQLQSRVTPRMVGRNPRRG